jgi:hypothetical protein
MVRPGVHFPQTLYTLVLRNGATVRVSSVVNMPFPKFLDRVRSCASDCSTELTQQISSR